MAATKDGEVERRICELQAANVPLLDWRDLLTERPEHPLSDEDRVALADYFGQFMATPTDKDGKQVCPCCRRVMRSGLEGALLGGAPGSTTLEWGLANGEAHCRECGYPYRVYHREIGGAGEDAVIKFLNCALAVHPSLLCNREEES